MIFQYQRVNRQIQRPLIPVFIKTSTKFIFYLALIDSGTDYSVFNIEVAKELGIKLSDKNINIQGISPKGIKGKIGIVTIRIGDISYKIQAVFAPINDYGYGILGGIGFFDHFEVKLSYRKRTIEIQPILRLS